MKFGALMMTGALVAGSALLAVGPQASASAAPGRTDCRTYSSVTTCGRVELTASQQKCVAHYTSLGVTEARATTECHAFSR
ncbi:hypothetical protein [Actinocorallia longicatena]|uniref:DUF3551 domain-containing protein n=1 Tax=Actinocorallia longicatena TaxID=111803 RepID=A0ABP6QNP3_9ACTN